MKRLLAIILSAVMVLGLCTFASYAEVADISIGTYDQLVSWASSSSDNEGQTVVLTADITAPASTTFTPKATFKGTFDGQGHSITGTTSSGSGLINSLYGTVRNLYQIGAVVTGDSGVGGIAGTVYGGALVENVYSNATVTATASNVGGIAGKQDSSTVTFNSCWFDGAATSGGIYVAGILGNQNHNSAVFTDCLNTGAITSSGGDNASGISSAVYNGYITATRCVNAGAIITSKPRWCGSLVTTIGNTAWDHDTSMSHCSFTDCYGVAGTCQNILPPDFRYSGNYATYDGTGIGTVDALDDLRALVSFGYNWGLKTVGEETLVVPMYFADESIPTTDYLVYIGTYQDLVDWAADDSNVKKTAVLTADIKAPANSTFTPKETFKGTFDGQGHSIKGTTSADAGLVKNLYGTVRNLYQLDATVTGSSSVGGIAATVYGGALVENVYSSATVTATGHHVGGIAGIQASSTVTFNSCWFDGTVTSSGGIHIAGILGNQNSNSAVFTDCLNTGTITSSGDNASGISASVYNGYITATRCVNAGTIVGTPRWSGSLVTTIGNTSWDHDTSMSHCSFTDCYGVTGTCQNILPPDFRYSSKYATYDGNGIGTIADVSYLESIPAFTTAWGLKTVVASSSIVPMYFADEPLEVIDPTIYIGSYYQLVSWASSASDDMGRTVVLTADITAPANSTFTPKASFRGIFDGQGHSIIGTTSSGSGLITDLYGTVRNLYQIDATVTGTSTVGGLAATIHGGALVENVYSSANVSATGNHVGGFAGMQAGSTVTFRSCWFDGTATAGLDYVAGILGNQNFNSAVFTDCLNTGTIVSGNDDASGISAAVYKGYINATRCVNAGLVTGANDRFHWNGAIATTIGDTSFDYDTSMSHCTFTDCGVVYGTCQNVLPPDFRYYTLDGEEKSPHYVTYRGTGIDAVNSILTLEINPAYQNNWGRRLHNGETILVPAVFAESEISVMDIKGFVEDLTGLSAWEDKGSLECTITKTGSNLAAAKNYVAAFKAEGFTLAYENTMLGDVYIAQLTKGMVLVTVSNASKQSKTFITVSYDQPLSPHLRDSFKSTAISGRKNSLSQIKLNDWGDSYVIQLKNGHFIVVDGGRNNELDDLLTYIESLTPSGQHPVIEAWFVTHLHLDHFYVVTEFLDNPAWANRVYIDGFYFNVPSDAVKSFDAGVYAEIAREHLAISTLHTSSGGTPVVYRTMTGQRYWFCDVSVDIVLSQDVLSYNDINQNRANYSNPDDKSGNGGFNDSSSWYLFTMDGKTFLEGGDSYKAGMNFLMSAYDYTDLRVDYFSVLHHGASTWNSFTNWICSGSASSSSTSQKGFKNLLFPTSYEAEYEGVIATSGSNEYLRKRASGSSYYAYLKTDRFDMAAVASSGSAALQSVSVVNGGKDVYDPGDELDKTGLTVTLTYKNPDNSIYSETFVYDDGDDFSGFTFAYDFSTSGNKEVTVSFGGKDASFQVTVNGPAFTYGDLNDDTLIDTRDLTLLRQYLADPTTEVNLSAADVDGNGPINTLDLTLLRQHLADGTVQLGPASAA